MEIIGPVIQGLRKQPGRKKGGFGSRPYSYYSQEEQPAFIAYILDLKPVLNLLRYTQAGQLSELARDHQAQLTAIVDRVDQYGELVKGWQQRHPISERCLNDFKERLNFWARRNIPDYCWQDLELPNVVKNLMEAVQAKIGGYTYEEDLFSWMIPLLVEELRRQLQEVVKKSRPELDLAYLKEQLQPSTEKILTHIRETYGLDGIEANDVVERALFLVMRATKEEYDENEPRLLDWAAGKLKSEIKLHVLFSWEPNMSHAWGLEQADDQGEWQKRRQLLQVFFDLSKPE